MLFFLEPSAQWEFTAVHALNFLFYLVALASFSFFMWEFLRTNRETAPNERLPDWSWLILGYALFTWSTIRLMPPHLPEPDLIICALLYMVFGILFRIRRGALTWGTSMLLGVLLGLGYLTKAIMFPMSFVFTGVALVLVGWSAKRLNKILAAFAVFLLLSLPYAAVLSDANGRWMFSDAGRLNYAWEINQVKRWSHWQGEEVVHGKPVHPTRKIHDNPPMYEFGAPFKVTYAPWYDPSYWYEGVKVTVDLQRQMSVFARNSAELLFFLANSPGPSAPSRPAYYSFGHRIGGSVGPLLTLVCVLVLVNLGRVSSFRRIADYWFVLVPIAAVFGAYALLHFEGRYLAAYVVVLWMVLFRSVAIPHSQDSRGTCTAILASAALITTITLAIGTGRAVLREARNFAKGFTEAPFLQSGYTDWKVAKYLNESGLRAGDRVGSVGWTYSAYWARMARVRVVAEIPKDEFPEASRVAFWSSDAASRAVAIQLFREVGARAVVATDVPVGSAPENWKRIENTHYYVYVL
jgi:4-amino-4-deoxy-L-arabinose transferase-like glycosyltransferase